MKREEFQRLAEGRILYLDGATGSNLVKAGMPSGVCPEQWILEHPDVMLELQTKYVEKGTDILYAPTFTANRVKLAEYGLKERMEDMIKGLVGISRKAADTAVGRKVYVAGDITMTGEQLRPIGKMELETLIEIYKEQIRMLEDAGVDLLVVETMMSLAEIRAALIAAKEVCELPVMVTATFEQNGRTLYGTDAKTAAVVSESLGACAFGANCSTGPARMQGLMRDIASVTRIPIIAKPNAGLPSLDGQGNTCYDMQADEFAREMELLVEAGATVLGGCCGTTPDYIEAIRQKFGREAVVSVPRRPDGMHYLASERMTVEFGLDGNFMIVGERINPTGKKALQEQLRQGCMDKVLQFAEEQEADGACVLDINMGMSGIDEKVMMLQAIEAVSGVTNLPLSLDSSHVDVLEAALRHYPGRALINSVSLEKGKFDKLLPLAAKYGAMFILLPLSDKGLPEDLEEKKEIIRTICERAFELGMRREDIVADGLVATVGANPKAALETLETIRYCKEQGLATICGLSNISFGMPERGAVNATFLVLAIREGLTMAIANPSQELLVSSALAADLLLAKEGADLRYIEYAGQVKEKRERQEAELRQMQEAAARTGREGGQTGSGAVAAGIVTDAAEGADNGAVGTVAAGGAGAAATGDIMAANERSSAGKDFKVVGNLGSSGDSGEGTAKADLHNAVLKGNRNGVAVLTQKALDAGNAPEGLLNDVLLPAINEVGELFEKGKYFLPQLIASAEAMKNAIAVLEPLLLRETEGEEMPTVVIATVEGDIHDIGKNLVALMLKNYGFRVIDLGKDVPAERIIAAAKENNAQIIALSALMTTTMQRMREVVEQVRTEKLQAKVMVGGAVVTQDYADEIGADGYSKDAADAVKLAKHLNGDA